MTNFKLTLMLATPFYCPHPLTLDALLSAAIFNATGKQGADTLEHIPLEMKDGIFKGSSLFCSPSYRHVTVGRVMSLKTENDLSTRLFAPKGKRYTYIDQARGDYKTNMSAYPGIQSHEVYFYGVGDPDKVVHLIHTYILGIGKRSNAGAGEIVGIDWREMDDDHSWKTSKGQPARPLPIELWKQIGGDAATQTDEMSVSLPYWATPKVKAVFPRSLVA